LEAKRRKGGGVTVRSVWRQKQADECNRVCASNCLCGRKDAAYETKRTCWGGGGPKMVLQLFQAKRLPLELVEGVSNAGGKGQNV